MGRGAHLLHLEAMRHALHRESIAFRPPAMSRGSERRAEPLSARVRSRPAPREPPMFSVMFEVHPKAERWDAYLGYAKMLKAELERIDGFVDNVRYRSLTRQGWLLSLSGWRDEAALLRWRTHA